MSDPAALSAPRIAGVATPPDWCDPTPDRFRSLVTTDVRVQQTIMPAINFDFTLDSMAATEPEMLVAARSLSQAGCQAIMLTGTPFTWAADQTEAGARALQERVSAAAGNVPFILPGLSIVAACRALGIKRPACCTTYYPPDWRACWLHFLRDCGLHPEVMKSMDQLGMSDPIRVVSDLGWPLAPERIVEAARAVRKAAPMADGMLIGGAGVCTFGLIEDLEREFGIPVIGADGAMVWGLARAMGVDLRDGCLGRVTHVARSSAGV